MTDDVQPLASAPFGSCALDEHGHCSTCTDEALPARVLAVDEMLGLATVALDETTTEVDISLIDDVAPDDVVLIHGGVAIEKVRSGSYINSASLSF